MLNKELKSNQNLLASARREISQKTIKYEKLIKEFNASKSTRAQEIPTNSLESQAITPETELSDIVVPKPSNKDLTDISDEAMDVEAAAVSLPPFFFLFLCFPLNLLPDSQRTTHLPPCFVKFFLLFCVSVCACMHVYVCVCVCVCVCVSVWDKKEEKNMK